MSDATRRSAVAERAARAGGVGAQGSFRTGIEVDTKAHKNDVVTDADRDAQRQVIGTIIDEFPDAQFVCEEDSVPIDADDVALLDSVPETGDVWVVDPIDGTANYVRGIRFWATSVAAIVDGRTTAATTYLPAEQDIYTAGPESVTHNGDRMTVSGRADTDTFCVGLIGWWPLHDGRQASRLFRTAADRFGDVRRMGSMQGMLALVASGSLDAAFMPETPHPWDALAGVELIRRAGGVATDIDGNPWSDGSAGLVVSNGECHDAIREPIANAVDGEPAD